MEDKLVTVAEFADSVKASLAQQILQDYGIKAMLLDQNTANIYTLPAVATTKLQTVQSQVKRARQILKENLPE